MGKGNSRQGPEKGAAQFKKSGLGGEAGESGQTGFDRRGCAPGLSTQAAKEAQETQDGENKVKKKKKKEKEKKHKDKEKGKSKKKRHRSETPDREKNTKSVKRKADED